ncbi:MAG: acetyl-CoA carboxylase biotin carboxyl carrier protein [Bacteroidota bacterium]
MEFIEIQDILRLVNRTNLTEVEIEKKDFRIKIRRKSPESNVIYTTQTSAAPPVAAVPPVAAAPATPPPAAEAPVAEKPAEATSAPADNANLLEFKSPMIGTFYRAPNPETPPFIKVGDVVEKGQVVCIVEAMKLFNEIESEVSGKVVKILVEDAQPVEYDQVLFVVDPNG